MVLSQWVVKLVLRRWEHLRPYAGCTGNQGGASAPTLHPLPARPYMDRHTGLWFLVEAGDNAVSILDTSTLWVVDRH